jgi:ABC-type polysaccharide/polyol phosphate export permease
MRFDRLIAALSDSLLEPLVRPTTWITLGWTDVVQSYRRTYLGPFWITLNMVIFSVAMTLVYGALFGIPTAQYAAYVVCGMIAWFWISALIVDGGAAFTQYSGYIRGMPVNKAHFVWAVAFKQLIILAHNAIVYVGLLALGIVNFNQHTWMIVPAVALIFTMSIPVVAVLSILYIRYRDLQKLMSSLTLIVLLVTPIFWQPESISGWRLSLATHNPVFYLVEVIRGPLSGRPIPDVYFYALLIMNFVFWIVGSHLYKRLHRFVIYWT